MPRPLWGGGHQMSRSARPVLESVALQDDSPFPRLSFTPGISPPRCDVFVSERYSHLPGHRLDLLMVGIFGVSFCSARYYLFVLFLWFYGSGSRRPSGHIAHAP